MNLRRQILFIIEGGEYVTLTRGCHLLSESFEVCFNVLPALPNKATLPAESPTMPRPSNDHQMGDKPLANPNETKFDRCAHIAQSATPLSHFLDRDLQCVSNVSRSLTGAFDWAFKTSIHRARYELCNVRSPHARRAPSPDTA